MTALSYIPSAERDADRISLGDALYLLLGLLGWSVVTCACVIGFWALFFAFLGEFDFSQAVMHIENFASRYVAADAVRQGEFRETFWLTSGIGFVVVGLLRQRSFGRIWKRLKEV
ncbi:MAG: hypothetical protein EBR34_08060 [Sphingomonadaceae bacterium]|nr:hypothetical protein [Sphingomonadaceae bacterium]